MQDASIRRGMKRELPTHAVDLALILLSESQKKLKSKEKRLRYMFSGIAQDEGIKEFFHHYNRHLRAAEGAQRDELKEVYTRHRKDVLKAFGMMDAWRLRFARCSFMDELALIESMLGDSMESLVMPNDGKLIEDQEQQLAKSDLHASLSLLYPACSGEESIAAYRNQLISLFEQLALASVDIDVTRLLPHVDVYQQDDAVQLLLTRVQPLLDANARRESPLRVVFTNSDDDRLTIVTRACCHLRQQRVYSKMELGVEIAACLDTAMENVQLLDAWTKERKNNRLTVRLIKGEHLPERRAQYAHAERQLRLSASKPETDLRLRDLVERLSESRHLHLDLGTHQLFDIAYTCAVWKAEQREDLPDFTLYSGVGDALAGSLSSLGGRVYLQSFHYSTGHESEAEAFRIALLNGLGDPFPALGVTPKLKPNTREWLDMVQQFQLSCNKAAQLRDLQQQMRPVSFRLPVQRPAIAQLLQQAIAAERAVKPVLYPPTIADEQLSSQFSIVSRQPENFSRIDYSVESLTYEQVAQLVKTAQQCGDIEPVLAARLARWKRVAELLDEQRPALIAGLMRDAGYRLADADSELGAAIALCHTVIAEISEPVWGDGMAMKTGGIAVVNASAERPLLDAIEGILSAHVLGYSIIYKPANTTRRLAELLLDLLAHAGVRRSGAKLDILLAQCMDNQVAAALFTHPAIDALFCYAPLELIGEQLQLRPHCALYRTPQRPHALYLRSDANWKQAIDELAAAYVRRSSQSMRCPSTLLVDASLYDDAAFQSRLKDSFSSLRLRDVAQDSGEISPLSTALDQQQWVRMTTLGQGENWLVAPDTQAPSSMQYRPAIRFGVALDSELVEAEFGAQLPLHLSVVRINYTEQAVELQARLSQGGCASLYCEDPHFIQLWKSEIRARLLTVNTLPPLSLTEHVGQGASAQLLDRQYSGDYLSQRARWEASGHPVRLGKTANLSFKPWDLITPLLEGSAKMHLHAACESINFWWEEYYGTQSRIDLPDGSVLGRRSLYTAISLRIESQLSDSDAAILIAAVLRTGQPFEVSMDKPRAWAADYLQNHQHTVHIESASQFHAKFEELAKNNILIRAPHANGQTRIYAAAWGLTLRDEPVLAQGRAELMRLCLDQWSLSRDKALTQV